MGSAVSLADITLAPFLFYVPRLAEWHGMQAFGEAPKCAAYLEQIAKDEHIGAAFGEMDAAYIKRVAQLRSDS